MYAGTHACVLTSRRVVEGFCLQRLFFGERVARFLWSWKPSNAEITACTGLGTFPTLQFTAFSGLGRLYFQQHDEHQYFIFIRIVSTYNCTQFSKTELAFTVQADILFLAHGDST